MMLWLSKLWRLQHGALPTWKLKPLRLLVSAAQPQPCLQSWTHNMQLLLMATALPSLPTPFSVFDTLEVKPGLVDLASIKKIVHRNWEIRTENLVCLVTTFHKLRATGMHGGILRPTLQICWNHYLILIYNPWQVQSQRYMRAEIWFTKTFCNSVSIAGHGAWANNANVWSWVSSHIFPTLMRAIGSTLIQVYRLLIFTRQVVTGYKYCFLQRLPTDPAKCSSLTVPRHSLGHLPHRSTNASELWSPLKTVEYFDKYRILSTESYSPER